MSTYLLDHDPEQPPQKAHPDEFMARHEPDESKSKPALRIAPDVVLQPDLCPTDAKFIDHVKVRDVYRRRYMFVGLLPFFISLCVLYPIYQNAPVPGVRAAGDALIVFGILWMLGVFCCT